jgi:cytoskeletal protein RodZ
MIEDFGAHLKSERELRGVTIDEVASKTKIHARYLHALENNQFEKLPGEVFIHGFIRSMAKVIGADENELLSAYSDIIQEPSHEDKNLSTPFQEKPKLNINFILLLSLVILFLAGALVGLNLIFQKDNKVLTKSSLPVLNSKQTTTGESKSGNLPAIIPKIEEPPSSLNETDATPKTSLNARIIPPQNLQENISGEPTLSNQVLKKEVTSEEKTTTSGISNKE